MRVHQRAVRKGVYLTLKIPLCFTILLYKEERWEAATGTGLSTAELIYRQKPIPVAINPRAHRLTQKRHTIHKTRYSVGIQQCTHKGGRPGERSLQDKSRTL